MLSSRWKNAEVYRCSSREAGGMFILATSLDNAVAAYEVSTGVPPEKYVLFMEIGDLSVTEEAQAQSELFPNQVRK